MEPSLNLDLINFRMPRTAEVFKNSAEEWLAFREVRFTDTGDGEYAVIKQLDLSGYDLNHFPADHIAFVQCNLDGVSFRGTSFAFETAFINCSMKHVDLCSTSVSDALFLDCDLTGAEFWAKVGWSTIDLDGKHIPSVLSGCKIDPETEKFLLYDGCLTDKSKLTLKQDVDLLVGINNKLTRIVTAPQLDV